MRISFMVQNLAKVLTPFPLPSPSSLNWLALLDCRFVQFSFSLLQLGSVRFCSVQRKLAACSAVCHFCSTNSAKPACPSLSPTPSHCVHCAVSLYECVPSLSSPFSPPATASGGLRRLLLPATVCCSKSLPTFVRKYLRQSQATTELSGSCCCCFCCVGVLRLSLLLRQRGA